MMACKRWVMFFIVVSLCASAGLAAAAAPFKPGETVRYAIKKAGIKVGEATLVFKGETYRDGKKYTLIIFTAKGFNFFDEERIFIDGDTFLPQMVIRDLNIFGNKEKIMEEYDQKIGTVKVTKMYEGRTEVKVLDKKGVVDNIYGFIYRYRAQDKFGKDEKFDIHLPTMDVVMSGVKEVDFDAGGRVYKALLLRSVPSKYSIWMDRSEKHIPLRIGGAVGIANTVMTMIEYKE